MTFVKRSTSHMLLFIALVFQSSASLAECLIVGDLTGWATKERNQYIFEQDGFTMDNFYLKFGEQSWMSNEPEKVRISCLDMGVLVCPDSRFDQVLTWSVNQETGKVLHTRIIGNSLFEGAMAMVGDVVDSCDY